MPWNFSLEEFDYLSDLPWGWYEKVDGMNMRIGLTDGKLDIRGRSDRAQIPGDLRERIRELFDPDLIKEVIQTEDFTIFGEGYGAGIQKGGHYSSEKDFIVFDIWIKGWWLRRTDMSSLCDTLGLQIVPLIGIFDTTEVTENVHRGIPSILSCESGRLMEGVVGTPITPLYRRNGERIIAKLKTSDF